MKVDSIVSTLNTMVHNYLMRMICHQPSVHAHGPHWEKALSASTHSPAEDWLQWLSFLSNKNCVHLCTIRSLHPSSSLLLKDQLVQFVDKVIFIGLLFDKKTNFQVHIRTLNWLQKDYLGGYWKVLLHLNHSQVRSHLDYDAVVYERVKPPNMQSHK